MGVMFWIWLAVLVVSVIIEIFTMDLVSIWFGVGAIIPLFLSLIDDFPIVWQIVIFIVSSALLMIFLRKIAQKLLFKNSNSKTNLDSCIGKTYRLLKETDFEKNGEIKVNGIVWTAVSEDGKLILAGELVEIVKVQGNKFVVKRVSIKEENENGKTVDEEIENKEEI